MTDLTDLISAAAEGDRRNDRDSDRLLLHRIVDDAFHQAVSRAGEVVSTFDIAGEVIRVTFAGDALAYPLTRAMAHHRVDNSRRATASIHVWDSRSSGRALPMLAASLLRLLDRTWLEDRDVRGEIKEYSEGPLRAAYHGPKLLSLFDTADRIGIFWLDDAAALPWYEPGAPFRVLLDWIVSSPTRQLVHAGAIAGPTGGVLLGGPGGSGKSTTALSCLRSGIDSERGSGLRYVSDDYVVVDVSGDPVAHGPYSTAKLKGPEDLDRFPTFSPAVTDVATAAGQAGQAAAKPMLFVAEHHAEHIVGSTQVQALVFPRYLALENCEITPITSSTAFKLLAPSTVAQIPTARSQALRCMRTLTFSVPCFTLGLPIDPSRIPSAIEEILARTTRAAR